MLIQKLLAATRLLSLSNAIPLSARSTNEWFNSPTILNPSNIYDGIGAGADHHQMYYGEGSVAAGWPSISEWASFDSMFNASKPVMRASCPDLESGPATTDAEIGQIWNAIHSAAWRTNVDHRFILAIVMQESKGCVRIHTTGNAVKDPGLLQDHNGGASCNVKAVIQDPCPDYEIFNMVLQGVAGTSTGAGLAGALNRAGGNDAQTYYRAARIYNSGSFTKGNLNDGRGSTNCYATDVASRLTGWVSAKSDCTLDTTA